ncbi:unnamed protein product [Lepeophtheirus salmonis]|uniref:(salmon louse) hypothetical protein n=1 Tax=Lepeophtheirus salmonis TaxID=72036 RepID=A0A7R8CM28_LEPSM|nr:unnamed protein product [Lepeophtheirus salmonis]CAF2828136.1 unnamed protein product [Lepeophtheirus salmonis]
MSKLKLGSPQTNTTTAIVHTPSRKRYDSLTVLVPEDSTLEEVVELNEKKRALKTPGETTIMKNVINIVEPLDMAIRTKVKLWHRKSLSFKFNLFLSRPNYNQLINEAAATLKSINRGTQVSYSADEKRRTEIIRSVQALNNLNNELQSMGFSFVEKFYLSKNIISKSKYSRGQYSCSNSASETFEEPLFN